MSTGVGYYAEIQAASQIGSGGAEYLRYWEAASSEPWCTFFLAWAVDTCQIGAHNHSCAWAGYGGVGYSEAVLRWGETVGKALPPGALPATGDFFIVDTNVHAGIVRGASTAQMLTVNGDWGGLVKEQSWTHAGGETWSDGTDHQIRFVRW
jgi:hypothetical protein